MAKRTYTPEQRTEALELYRTDGPTAASNATGIPKQTIADWARTDGIRTVRNERTAVATEAARQRWEERRVEMAHDIGHLAARAMARALEEVEAGSPRDAKDLTTTMAICVDKAQLLVGGATSRHEHSGPIEAEIARLEVELANA